MERRKFNLFEQSSFSRGDLAKYINVDCSFNSATQRTICEKSRPHITELIVIFKSRVFE